MGIDLKIPYGSVFNMPQIPKFYIESLKLKIAANYGTQAEFCRRHNLQPSKINDIIKGRKNLTFDSMDDLSKMLGASSFDMIVAGKEMVEGDKKGEPLKCIVCDGFLQKQLSAEINTRLKAIEKLDPGRLEEINAQLSATLSRLQQHAAPYDPNKPDRRKVDRRKASGE